MINLNGAIARTRSGIRRSTSTLLLGAVTCVCVAGIGCSATSTTTNSLVKSFNAYLPATGTSEVTGAVTLFANTTFLTSSLGFGTIGSSGGYVSLTSGTYNLYASLPGALQPFAQITSGTLFNGNNTPYTVIAAGEAGQTGTFAPQIVVMPDYTNSPLTLSLASGQCAIRVVNLSFNQNPIGLYATTNGNFSVVAPDTTAVPFGYGASSNPYEAVNTTSLINLAIVDSTKAMTALTLPYKNNGNTSNLTTNTFIAGDAYTLVIFGQPGNANAFNALGAIWIQDYPHP